MKSSIVFHIFVILWCFSNHPVTVKSENALIYNWKFENIDQLKFNDDPCQNCLTACPASSDLEAKFDQDDSIARVGNSLFLKEIYRDVEYKKNMRIDICNKPFKPVMIWDKKEQLHRIGYELYYNEEQKQQTKFELRCNNYDNFRKIIINGKPSTRQFPASNRVKRYKDEDGVNTVFELLDDASNQKLVFYWLPVLSIKSWVSALTNQSKFNHRRITFEKDVMNIYTSEETITECKDYNLGNPLPQTNDENEELREIMELPLPPSYKPTICKQSEPEDKCMGITQIIPMMYFHTTAAKLATCTYLNLAHIWENIINGQLKKIDRYLYAMYRIWASYNIQITFGISGEMESDEESVESTSTYEATVNLIRNNTTRNFPTPLIMYRIVRYEVQGHIYQTIIVIHNNLNLELAPHDRVCSKNEEVGGWSKIKNQLENKDEKSGSTYACPVTEKSILNLGIYDHDTLSPSEALKLNAFPEYKNGKLDKVDKTDDIEKELKYITEDLGIVK